MKGRVRNLLPTYRTSLYTERNILMEAMQSIINNKDNRLDVGYLFIHDHVNDTFKCRGVIPREYHQLQYSIIGEMRKNGCRFDAENTEAQAGCGLFCYVGKKFRFENEVKTIAIPDLEKFKHKGEFEGCHIDFNYLGKRAKAEFVLPVFIVNRDDEESPTPGILHAVVVFISFENNKYITNDDLLALSNLLSILVTSKINLIADKGLNSFVNHLSDFEAAENFNIQYDRICDALHQLYRPKEGGIPRHCLLKHASIWTLNDADPDNYFLVKERNFFRPQGLRKTPTLISSKSTRNGKPHYFYEFIRQLPDRWRRGKQRFQALVDIRRLKDISSQLYNKDSFFNSYNIKDDDIVVLFPILPHISKKSEFGARGLMVLYFDKNTYPYYYDAAFLELISHKVYENLKIMTAKIRRRIRFEMLHCIVHDLDEIDRFFSAAVDHTRKNVDCENCLIYLFNSEKTGLELKSASNPKDFPKNLEIQDKAGANEYNAFSSNEEFTRKIRNFLKELIEAGRSIKETKTLFYNASEGPGNHHNSGQPYSIMMLPIYNSKEEPTGVLICLNNKRIINRDCASESSYFSPEDADIAFIGAEVTGIINEIYDLARYPEEILQKYSHEIPGLASLIMNSTDNVSEELRWIGGNIDVSKIYHIQNVLSELNHAAFRIDLYSQTYRVRRITEEIVEKEAELLSIGKFLHSSIRALNNDARRHGIFVEFFLEGLTYNDEKILVHPFFTFAVTNLINNAIQYSYFGSRVLVLPTSDNQYHYFSVENVGIPIRDEIKDKIYDEKFRSEEAKKKNFKGMGLGLALAKRVVEVHGGEIFLERDNDFVRRNIFGLSELHRTLTLLEKEDKKWQYLNQNLPKKRSFFQNMKKLILTKEEMNILGELSRFKISSSERTNADLCKSYLDRLFQGSENIDIIYNKQIDVLLSRTKFIIRLPKRK